MPRGKRGAGFPNDLGQHGQPTSFPVAIKFHIQLGDQAIPLQFDHNPMKQRQIVGSPLIELFVKQWAEFRRCGCRRHGKHRATSEAVRQDGKHGSDDGQCGKGAGSRNSL